MGGWGSPDSLRLTMLVLGRLSLGLIDMPIILWYIMGVGAVNATIPVRRVFLTMLDVT